MSEYLLISTLFFYLLSVVGCLLLFLFSRNISLNITKTVLITHFLIGLTFGAFYFLKFNIESWIYISFWCSGILLAGDVARKPFHKLIKVYFLMYLITIPAFIVTPSRIISLVAGHGFGKPGEGRYRIVDNLYLVKTAEPKDNLERSQYKLIKEMGFFHKTLARGIPASDNIDSIVLNRNYKPDNINEIYIFQNMNIDTIKINQYRIAPKRNQITRKPY